MKYSLHIFVMSNQFETTSSFLKSYTRSNLIIRSNMIHAISEIPTTTRDRLLQRSRRLQRPPRRCVGDDPEDDEPIVTSSKRDYRAISRSVISGDVI